MSHSTSKLDFLSFPREIRGLIYDYLLPLGKDTASLKRNDKHEGNVQYVEGCLKLCRDGVSCYTAILAVNKQIYAEAFQTLYSRTFTITLTATDVEFLCRSSDGYGHNQHTACGCVSRIFPKSFPFAAISALRIRIIAFPKWDCQFSWIAFQKRLYRLSTVLSMLTLENGVSLRELIIDAPEPSESNGPGTAYLQTITYIGQLFKSIMLDSAKCQGQ